MFGREDGGSLVSVGTLSDLTLIGGNIALLSGDGAVDLSSSG
jgi:hypothetical protein